jgi:hypothetical protein
MEKMERRGVYFMAITTHHVHNVLRAYRKQLKGNKNEGNRGPGGATPANGIAISAEAKRKAVLEKVTSDIVQRIIHAVPPITTSGNHACPGQDRGEESRPGEDNHSERTFKVINREQGEFTKKISLEDSESLEGAQEEGDTTESPGPSYPN